jgi:HPr kinase/phosphorylase
MFRSFPRKRESRSFFPWALGPRFREDERGQCRFNTIGTSFSVTSPTIHASAVLLGARAALIRGPSGVGKSRLAFALIQLASSGALAFARLVGDDRVHIEAIHGRLLVRPAPTLAGTLEIRGLGLRRLPYEPVAQIGLLVDLDAPEATRLPDPTTVAALAGVSLPRLCVAPGADALGMLVAALRTPESAQ